MINPRLIDKSGRIKGSQGFTLIELMLVIAVIGILMIVTIPKYEGIRDYYHLNSAVKKLETQLKYAKQLAMDNRKDIYVVFDPNNPGVFYVVNWLNQVLITETLDSGITFDSVNSQGTALVTVTINGIQINGEGVDYNKYGFTKPYSTGNPIPDHISIIFTSARSGGTVSVNIANGTGYITTAWSS